MQEFIDVEGLTYGDGDSLATALNLQGVRIFGSDRYSLLSELRNNADSAMVLSGPRGAAYWSLVSPSVIVRVVPDNYDYKFRTTDEQLWSYLAAGCTNAEAKQLQTRSSVPDAKHKLYPRYVAAEALHSQLRSVQRSDVPLVQSGGSGAVLVTDINEQLALLSGLKDGVALDLEWTIHDQRLIGVNVSDSSTNWYLPVLGRNFDQSSYTDAIKSALRTCTSSKQTKWHNFKADIRQVLSKGQDPLSYNGTRYEDTILMGYLAGEEELGLKELSKKLLGRESIKLPDALELQPIELAARYGAAGDTRNTYDLYEVLERKLRETNQWKVYTDIERPIVPLVASMEHYGSPMDMAEVKRLRDEYYTTETAIESMVWQRHRLDFRDEADQRAYVTRLHGRDLGTLDKRVLSRITDDWLDTLLAYRGIKTLRRNFLDKHIEAWMEAGCPNDYRAYPTFNQAGRVDGDGFGRAPATGRFSSARPNFQNQPREIRSVFTAPDGMSIVSLDYSKLEMVVGASVSQDPVMIEALKSGDIHSFMQSRILQETGIQVTRTAAKNAGFNLRYGGQADMLMTIAAKERAHLDYATAKSIVDVDHSTYTGYWNWFEQVVKDAGRNGYSETLWGRRRYNENLFSSDSGARGHAERGAANMVVQGTAADIIKLAMGRLIPVIQYYKAHLAIQVHDELVFFVPDDKAVAFRIAAKQVMESIPIPHLTLAVEGKIGKNWAEAH